MVTATSNRIIGYFGLENCMLIPVMINKRQKAALQRCQILI
jgi:hypothetical protein